MDVSGPRSLEASMTSSLITPSRRTALLGKIPYYTTIAGASAAAEAIASIKNGGGLDVKSIQAYFSTRFS